MNNFHSYYVLIKYSQFDSLLKKQSYLPIVALLIYGMNEFNQNDQGWWGNDHLEETELPNMLNY